MRRWSAGRKDAGGRVIMCFSRLIWRSSCFQPLEGGALQHWTKSAAVPALTLTLVFAPGTSSASDLHRFDGRWLTTVSCSAVRDALGYSYRFAGDVKEGKFYGLHGTKDEAGYLEIDGIIEPDGNGKLYAQGRTGSKEFVPGRDTPRGTEFGYHIDARFEESKGSGVRLEGRPCTLQFEKR
jgi:hypothetical protein